MENKFLTRIPMKGRLYHIKYDTLISNEGFMSHFNGVDPKDN